MSEIIICDKCKKEIAEDDYGVSTASDFTLQVLKNGVWHRYHGHFCVKCRDDFVDWMGMKE